jgi:hypothetical protein
LNQKEKLFELKEPVIKKKYGFFQRTEGYKKTVVFLKEQGSSSKTKGF